MKQKLHDLELQLLDPQIRLSVEVLDKLISDDFVEIGSSGKKYSKQDILDHVPTSTATYNNVSDFEVREIGIDLFLVTYSVETRSEGEAAATVSLRSSIWKKEDGDWKMMFHQGTKVMIE